MNRAPFTWLLYVMMVLLFGCDQEKTNIPSSNWLNELYTGDLIIGAGIGDSPDQVIKAVGEADAKVNDELVYKGIFSNNLAYTQYINIDADEVFEITVDFHPQNDSINDHIFQLLQDEMDKRYQQSRPADGYATWKKSSKNGKLVEVSLVDESMENGAPLIMLNYLENYERTFTAD